MGGLINCDTIPPLNTEAPRSPLVGTVLIDIVQRFSGVDIRCVKVLKLEHMYFSANVRGIVVL